MEGRWRGGAQEEKAWEERILTGHTEAAGSTSEEDLLGIYNPQGLSVVCNLVQKKPKT